jgi:HAD superfamily hydrolase (TIGR01459 family)
VTNGPDPAFVSGLASLAPRYRALLCDVWGVVHNGVGSYAAAVEALIRYRAGDGIVLFVTNAPRPGSAVIEQLDRLGVDREAYDDVVTSGEAARGILAARPGIRVMHVGPARDLPLYAGLPVELVDEQDCELVSCTGLFDDETETPDDYRQSFQRWLARGLPLLCANPDIVVERGDRLIWCAGALAERYRGLGGVVIVVGKPHAPFYRAVLDRLEGIAGAGIPRSSILAIGDGIDTDIRGAIGQEIDAVFVTGGIHGTVLGDRQAPDLEAVHALLRDAGLGASALMAHLSWNGRS